ncbi:glycoside hydrolase family 18 protein [Dysgonomonas termitidis]|uniref:chitinase n=1 Tax=Dysgonomonas termitidis TaxID=1516126 RepID=A0ABV9L462_9BACT
MRNHKIFYYAVGIMILFTTCKKGTTNSSNTIIVAYVTSWSDIMPDPTHLTHINYAFGHVSETFREIRVDNEERLKAITDLKQIHPHLKIFLSIGGWGSGHFSEMAADDNLRELFAKDCKRVVDQFNLDGIDIDWEYPTDSAAGISASEADTDNFTLLMKDIRQIIGEEKLLTLASSANAKYINFKEIDPYVDFVNIMSYDMGSPPYHHSGLYKSENTRFSVDEAVKAHVEAGMPINKLVMGIPFYGRASDTIKNANYNNLIKLTGFDERWDDVSQVPYLVGKNGEFICGFDNSKSIAIKCQYIKAHGMLGAMYWEYNGDDDNGTLRKALHKELNN